MSLRVGDIVGLDGDIFTNFIYLWWKRGLKYAWKNRLMIVPSKFYVVCKARRNELLYLAEGKKCDIRFRRLKKVMWHGRPQGFDALKSQMDLNDYILNTHYELTTHKQDMFGKNANKNFLYSCGGYGRVKFNIKFTEPKSKMTNLDIIETGNYAIIVPD